ncbi:alpha/beta hydrolase [Chelativorans sp.]|uniref:alpha/beta hydrolase n=1 Tax=Chelativorans sp. TaxID=2203393 RepID=UPI0028128062|nr:alpha/beta hydrolase [Chelativorans sp.]
MEYPGSPQGEKGTVSPDYAALVDAQTWAFIQRVNAFYPPEAIGMPITKNREVYERTSRAFFAGYPEGVAAETSAIAAAGYSIPIRIYRPGQPSKAATVLYFHGGGFILGSLDSHDDICAELSAATGYTLVSVGYRLAPEHSHHETLDDVVAAFNWAAEAFSEPLVLVGESAGGTLAACLARQSRGHPRAPVGQVLIYPYLGGDMETGSYVAHADAPMLTTRDLRTYVATWTGGADVAADLRFMPLADDDFSGLPPTVIFSAECDPLSSDGKIYCERVRAAGGLAYQWEEHGLIHGYLRGRHMVDRARASFARIIHAIKAPSLSRAGLTRRG